MQVDAVQQARDAARVARHLVRRAGAGAPVPAPAAGARVHGRDQLEAGRKARRAHGPRDQHPAGFQRLAQRFQRAPVEFGQFIQKQHAVMRQADLSRPGMGAAAHQRRHGQGMMRRPEWRLPSGRLRMAGQRRHGRGLQRRRDSGGNRPGNRCASMPCPGAHHQQAVAAGGRHFQCARAGWPRTSDRQGTGGGSGQGAGTASGRACAPVMCAATSARLRADSTRRPGTQAACSARRAGRASRRADRAPRPARSAAAP